MVERSQIPKQDRDGTALENNVMGDENERVSGVRQPEEIGQRHRLSSEIEWPARDLLRQAPGFGLTLRLRKVPQIGLLEIDGSLLQHKRNRRSVRREKHGSQNL